MTKTNMAQTPPPLEYLRKLLHYDPMDGEAHWQISRARWVKAGERAGRVSESGCRVIKIDTVTYKARHLFWYYVHGVWPTEDITHVNENYDDDRITNLRMGNTRVDPVKLNALLLEQSKKGALVCSGKGVKLRHYAPIPEVNFEDMDIL